MTAVALGLSSAVVAWPQIVILVALTVGCFVGAYIGFLRQEVRA